MRSLFDDLQMKKVMRQMMIQILMMSLMMMWIVMRRVGIILMILMRILMTGNLIIRTLLYQIKPDKDNICDTATK